MPRLPLGTVPRDVKRRKLAALGLPTPIPYTSTVGRLPAFNIAGWSSPVAREAHNLEVVGSNPAPATRQNATAEAHASAFCVSASARLGYRTSVPTAAIR